MILTNCAACAAPLAHDAPRCARCQTRYCEYRQTADLATLSVRGLKALVRERNLNIRYPIERSEVIAALTAPEEAGRWVFWEGVTKVR